MTRFRQKTQERRVWHDGRQTEQPEKQDSGQAQSSRKEQTGRQEQARETKEALRVLGRVIRYMAANYKLAVTAVLACIIVSAGATLKGMVFIQSLVDDYIRPLAQQASTGNTAPDFSPLAGRCAGWQSFT